MVGVNHFKSSLKKYLLQLKFPLHRHFKFYDLFRIVNHFHSFQFNWQQLASYGGRLQFKRNLESLQGGPARIRRNPEESGGNHEREPNGRRIHPTVGNYVFEADHNGFWFNRRNRKPHANDVPLVKAPPTHKHDFDDDDVMSGPRMLNLTGQNVAVIVVIVL